MRRGLIARGLGVAGFSAGGAVVAHAGPAAIGDWVWMGVALAGALLGVGFLALSACVILRLRSRAAALEGLDVSAAIADVELRRSSLPPLVAVMLVCQGTAHVGLLLLGVPARMPFSPEVHVLLAVAGAAVLWLVERRVCDHTERVRRLVTALVEWLRAGRPARNPALAVAVGGLDAVARRGRAPPAAFAVT
jgi:hypothetical protein